MNPTVFACYPSVDNMLLHYIANMLEQQGFISHCVAFGLAASQAVVKTFSTGADDPGIQRTSSEESKGVFKPKA